MRSCFAAFVLIACLSCGQQQNNQGNADPPAQTSLSSSDTSLSQIGKASGIVHAGNTYDVFIVDYPEENVRLYWKDDAGRNLKSLDALKDYLENKGQKLVFATNAGIYLEDYSPQGLYVENGEELRPIDLKKKVSNANFYMQPNGVFLLTKTKAKIVVTEDYPDYKDQTLFATQSGPMLVIDRKVNNLFKKGSRNVYIRSGVGINDRGQLVFAISNSAVSFYDIATLFRDSLNCDNALYMDGAICRTYLPALKRYQTGGDFGAMIGITSR
jgi:uncharacterized protein YigE (DUF2233 family)